MVDPESIYLLIFIVALGLTLVSFAAGVAGIHFPGDGHGHADGLHVHVGHGNGHVDVHGHVPHGGTNGHLGHADPGTHPHGGVDGISPLNFSTVLAFLTWFGGAGYLLTAHFGVGALVALTLAAAVGLFGASIVFFFLVRVLLKGQTPFLRDEDYELEGTIGRLSVGIRAGRTGEVVFSKAGTRRVASARSADGDDIPQGAEVVVIHQERGIAYVRPFEDLLAEEPRAAARN